VEEATGCTGQEVPEGLGEVSGSSSVCIKEL
jgi:hypothetical protein